jgi:hypothetical protein
MAKVATLRQINDDVTNGGKEAIDFTLPYLAKIRLKGTADLLFHRWNAEAVDEKAKAAKNSAAKKTDNIESYVYRNEAGELCVPGEYVRGAMIMAAKFKQDPRSPRKSAMDLFKAGIVATTVLASLGTADWDYEDRRRVVVQRSGINRVRPAMRAPWEVQMDFMVTLPEYISEDLFHEILVLAGRIGGIGDFRPTYGRFSVTSFDVGMA